MYVPFQSFLVAKVPLRDLDHDSARNAFRMGQKDPKGNQWLLGQYP